MTKTLSHTITLWLALLLTAVLAPACSSSDDDHGQEAVDILSRFNREGKAWLTLQIMGTRQAATRAGDDNGQFDDGSGEDEVSAENYVLIFAGSSEPTATFAGAYKAVSARTAGSALDQITKQVVISNHNIVSGDHLYAFVVLNNNEGGITTTQFPCTTTLGFADGSSLRANESTLSDLQAVKFNKVKTTADGKDYFVMTNDVRASKPGGTANPDGAALTTLVAIADLDFYSSEAEAMNHPAATIIVDRLAAKVTVKLADDFTSGSTVAGNTALGYTADDLAWGLDNYNTQSFVCKAVDDGWLGYSQQPGSSSAHASAVNYYRFVEQAPVNDTYRTYWTRDVNYTSATGLTDYTAGDPDWKAMAADAYCAENTMDVAHMTTDHTTSVVLRLRLNGGAVFYTTSVTGSDVIYQAPGDGDMTISGYLRQWLLQFDAVRDWVDTYADGNAGCIRFAAADPTVAGTVTFAVTQTAQTAGDGLLGWDALDVAGLLARITVTQYPGGCCYYRVPIRHFGDELTPWASTAAMDKRDTRTVYGNGTDYDDAKYLGRYGVVRNNWYTVTLRGVSRVGSAVIPPLTGYADDTVEPLVKVTVQVSKWAVHNQTMDY